jgi:dCMP deaminase
MKFDITLMETAKVWAEESRCKRLKVGSVIAKDSRIISTGFNGTLPGQDNNCEIDCTVCKGLGYIEEVKCERCNGGGKITNDFVIHAEQNAILFATKYGISTKDATLYCTHSPCNMCAKIIAGAGIKRVVYEKDYRSSDGIDFLKDIGVEIKRIK